MRTKTISVVTAALLLLAVAGCGGDEAPRAGSTSSPTPSPSTQLPAANDMGTVDVSARGATVELTIETVGRAFKPTFIKAAPGQTLNLTLSNPGDTLHTFTITSPQLTSD